MAQLSTLDVEYQGLPHVTISISQESNNGLDYEYGGLPFWAEELLFLAAGSNAIIVTAVEADFLVGSRRLPNRRKEAEKESQIKHVEPPCPPQVISFLP